MKKVFAENTVKNVAIIVLLFVLYQPMVSLYTDMGAEHYDSLLVTVTLLIMAVLFADYAFTYARTKMDSPLHRYLSHGITFIITFCTGLMLESVIILVTLKTGMNVWPVNFVAVAFYVSLVMYDFWDLARFDEK